ncbi:putative class A beta-lactamase [Gordonia effusa NBRC 100432]|uniref:Beta-lactamase n=1 Tax=Gordonia effusa NBRC 100432 TaxID=1077974 RepID=H0R324_9ACTN|nr:putative class A beta-lactamase [Gordonia effusa NBRC 100432]
MVTSARTAAIEAQIRDAAAMSGAEIGVAAYDPATGATVKVNSANRFPMLSTFKTYAVAEILRKHGIGARLDARVRITSADIVVNSPVTSAAVGTSMSLQELCIAALTRSDNTAGNLLLRDLGGPTSIATTARRLGDDQSSLTRIEPDLNSAAPGDFRDTTTPDGLLSGYRQLLDGGAGQHISTQLLEWMRATKTSDQRTRAGLPAGWTTADKTGSGDYGTTNAAGVILTPSGKRLYLVIMTRDARNRSDAPAFNALLARVTQLLTPLIA